MTDEVQSGWRNWDCGSGFWATVQSGKSEAEDFMAKEVHQKKDRLNDDVNLLKCSTQRIQNGYQNIAQLPMLVISYNELGTRVGQSNT